MNGRRGGAQPSFRTIAMLMAIPLAGLAVFFFWNWLHDGITPGEAAGDVMKATRPPSRAASPRPAGSIERDAGVNAADVTPGSSPATQVRPTRKAPQLPDRGTGAIVLIIDDLGFEGQPLEAVMALDPNVNCSILPNGPRSRQFAELLHSKGFEVLCHLPMEPQGRQAPGRGAVLTSMHDDEIEQLTRANVEAIPHARGVNNHMGSRATADRRVMLSVMRAMPEGLYFIDSRTTGRSVAASIAREMGIRTATRHVFLDDIATEDAVRRQLAELVAAAEKRGIAIGIGHPYAVTLRVLAEELPGIRERGLRLVRASEAVQ